MKSETGRHNKLHTGVKGYHFSFFSSLKVKWDHRMQRYRIYILDPKVGTGTQLEGFQKCSILNHFHLGTWFWMLNNWNFWQISSVHIVQRSEESSKLAYFRLQTVQRFQIKRRFCSSDPLTILPFTFCLRWNKTQTKDICSLIFFLKHFCVCYNCSKIIAISFFLARYISFHEELHFQNSCHHDL